MSAKLHTNAQRRAIADRAQRHAKGVLRNLEADGGDIIGLDLQIAWKRGFDAGYREALKRYAERANGKRR